MLEDKLKEIGFSASEARVYVELLRIGPQAVSTIAVRVGINRTTTYTILKALEQKGVVSSYKKGNLKFFSGNDPNCLVAFLDRKCRFFGYYRNQIVSEISKFREIMNDCDFQKPVVRFLDGVEGLKHVLFDILSSKKELRIYLSLNSLVYPWLRTFFIECVDIPMKLVSADSEMIRAFFDSRLFKGSRNAILHVSNQQVPLNFSGAMIVCGDRVFYMHLSDKDEYGIVLVSRELANVHKIIFDVAWNGFKMGG